ncbi:MAG: trigger factor [Planctomycetes bacterium]|nr:trigger factor [Planctomycetota bacterium]
MSDETTNTPDVEESASAEQDTLPANKVAIEDAGPSTKKITIEIDRARIDAKFDSIFGDLRRNAQVPGFRVGHAPRRLLEKRFGKEAAEDVRNGLVAEALGKVAEDSDLRILGEPDLKLDDIELPDEGNLVFSVEVEVSPEFDLPDYKGIKVDEPSIEVTEERAAETTRNILSARGTLAPTDEPAAAGDQVVADVAMAGEGIEEKRENVEYQVAPAAFSGVPLEDLGEKLTGAKAGSTVQVKATVPQGHANEDWRGKEVAVTFDVKEVKRLEVPELTDELAKEFGMESAEAFGGFIKERLGAQLETERRQSMRQQVVTHLLEKTKIDLPEGLAARQAARVLQRRYIDLLYRGVPREQIDQNLELLQARASEEAADELRLSFILDRIAEAEKITVEEGEVNARIAEMAMRQGRRPERLRSEMSGEGSLGELENRIREQKTLDRLLELAEIAPQAPAPASDESK